MWSPWNIPFGLVCRGARHGVVQDGIVNGVPGQHTVIWCQYPKMELGGQDRAGQGTGWVLPIPYEHKGMCCLGKQRQQVSQDVRVGFTLKRFPCSQVEPYHQNGGLSGLP